MFMFLEAEGLHNPVNTFFDNGCCDAIFKSEIPEKELKGVLLNKGPFQMGGVGDIVTTAEDEWLLQFNRTDGKKQLVKGVTMKQITCDFPRADISEVTAEIKANKLNPDLENCSLPKEVGGTVHVLLGIRYSNVAPVPIYQLECGLTVFKTRLKAHDGSINSVIGGPHTSFKFLRDRVGDVQTLLAHFTAGLKKIRQFGPSLIPNNPMSKEEESFAMVHNAEESDIVWEYLQQTNQEELATDSYQLTCSVCHTTFTEEEIDDADSLKEIRRLRLEQECGLDNNYRCVRCRDCKSCLDANKSEDISIKEEREMEKIDHSVELDFENRKIK